MNGDWGLGIGDWGLGIGDWAQSPLPNPQSPIPMNKKNIQRPKYDNNLFNVENRNKINPLLNNKFYNNIKSMNSLYQKNNNYLKVRSKTLGYKHKNYIILPINFPFNIQNNDYNSTYYSTYYTNSNIYV